MTRPFPALRQALVVLALFTVAQALYNTTIPLSGDEAYYWVWSRHLQAGYYDHPPVIALAIRLTTALFGNGLFGIRMAAALCMAGAVIYVLATARAVFGERVVAPTLVLALLLPMTEMGFTLATPDAPLTLFWAAGVYHGMRAACAPDGERRWADIVLAGIASGLAMASKYTGLLLPVSVLLFLILRRRDLLLTIRPWVAVVVAIAVFSPVLWWNAQHGFKSFAFQYAHGSDAGFRIHWRLFAQFIGGQFAVLSPVVLILLVARLVRWREWWGDDRRLFLATLVAAPLALFLYKGLFVKIQLNWATPAYIAAIPLVADFIVSKRLWRTAAFGAVLAIAMIVAIKWPLALDLEGRLNIQSRLFGSHQAAAAVARARRPGDALFADNQTRAALLTYLLPGHPRVYIPTDAPYSQYTMWDAGTDFRAMHGLYLSKYDQMGDLKKVFGRVVLLKQVVARAPGFRTERYFLYRVGPAGG